MSDVIEWFQKAVAADPAGWIAIGLVVVGASVFWRWTWRFLKGVGRVLLTILRGIGRIRITTVGNLKPNPKAPPIPVRWEVLTKNGAAKDEYSLVNFGEGSVALNVRLDAEGDGVFLRSSAFWRRIEGGMAGEFKMVVSPQTSLFGIHFTIHWTDSNGRSRFDAIDVRGV